MRVKLKEDIRIKELSKNNWYGCRGDTMTFIELFYNTDSEQDVFVATKKSDGFYKIITNDGEYVVTPNVFEIIEEDKEIEKGIKPFEEYWEEIEVADCDKDEAQKVYLDRLSKIVIELIKAVNELKKGK